jgi:hypothetical protein
MKFIRYPARVAGAAAILNSEIKFRDNRQPSAGVSPGGLPLHREYAVDKRLGSF